MTVISTLITKFCTTHATDSFVTELQRDGSRIITETQKTKIIQIKKFRGALSYWGLATYKAHNWSTYDWLNNYTKKVNQYSSAEKFAHGLKQDLNITLSEMKFGNELDGGIGIHFTAYEYIKGYRIPELFLITNYENPNYTSLFPDGIRVYRNTFTALCNMREPEKGSLHREFPIRKIVYDAIQAGRWLIFNNGDPKLFNAIAGSIINIYQIYAQRRVLKNPNKIKTYHDISYMAVDTISKSGSNFCQNKHRLIGGKIHALAIAPDGTYYSDTGD